MPFVNHVYPNGEPDLRVLSQTKVAQCVDQKLCGICGLRLELDGVVFVGGEVSCLHSHFADPAMHEECARYAMKVCPYLACQNYHHSKSVVPRVDDPTVRFGENPLAPPKGDKRPDNMGLYFTTGFKWVLRGGGTRLIKAYKATRIEWF